MIFINIGVFLAILLLGYFIGWKSGYDEVTETTVDILNKARELGITELANALDKEIKDGGKEGEDSQIRVRNDNGDMEV